MHLQLSRAAGRPGPGGSRTCSRSGRRRALTLLALVLVGGAAPVEGAAQQGDAGPRLTPPSSAGPLTIIGSTDEDLLRSDQLLGAAADGFLLRSTSVLTRHRQDDPPALLRVLAPQLRTTWNSGIPYSPNSGYGWAGRGWSSTATAGVQLHLGWLTVLLAPHLTHAQNRDFQVVEHDIPGRSEFAMPWFTDTLSIDLPVRLGDEPITELHPGQSSVTLHAGPVSLGGGTENHWWGPGVRNAIVLSNNAPGFPHLFARSTRPLPTPVGELEWIWIAGELKDSGYYRGSPTDGSRSFSGFAATYRPRWEPDLWLGLSRAVYAHTDDFRDAIGNGGRVFRDWSGADEMATETPDSEQILSLFGRWIFPGDGVEAYAEWARYRLPLSLRDLLQQPHHTQGYTLGLQWLHPVLETGYFRVQAEATNLERSATYRLRPIGSYYSSSRVPEGYTHQGRVLGAAIGPGSSAQWLATDFLGPSFRLGIYGGRIRWHNDAYFRRTAPWLFFGHDVSLLGGVRGGSDVGGLRIEGDLTVGKRYNFLFQNWGAGWDQADFAVDIVNWTVGFNIVPLAR